MISWEVVYTEQAETDLRDVYEYIAFSLLEPEIAKRQTRRIIDAITSLNHLPLRCQRLDREPWGKRGMRVMPVDQNLVFYLPIKAKKSVAIIRIMYGGRDIEAQLSETDKDDRTTSAVVPMSEGNGWVYRLYDKEPGLLKVVLIPDAQFA